MGLDTTHNCWHGSYSSFNRFREAIISAASPLDFMHGPEVGDVDFGKYVLHNYAGWWNEGERASKDPLEVLIVHSDCDGWIFPEDADPLADRLEEFIERVDADWQSRVREFINGLRSAADQWLPVGFH